VLFATHDRSLLDIRPRRVVVLDEGRAFDVPQGLEPGSFRDAQSNVEGPQGLGAVALGAA
jgi:cell division transport system ATP-binding protein